MGSIGISKGSRSMSVLNMKVPKNGALTFLMCYGTSSFQRHFAPFLIFVDFDVSPQPTSFKGAIFVSRLFISVIDRDHSEKLPINLITERDIAMRIFGCIYSVSQSHSIHSTSSSRRGGKKSVIECLGWKRAVSGRYVTKMLHFNQSDL